MNDTVKVPKHFFEVSNKETFLQIINSFGLFLIPGVLSTFFVYLWGLWGVIPSLPCWWVAAHGLQCVGLLGHEGTHFSLHKNKFTSSFLGVFFSSFLPLHLDAGFAVLHADHHRFTNTEQDPDFIFFRKFQTFKDRLLHARFAASLRYLKTTLRLAFNKWPKDQPIRVGLSHDEIVLLARLNLVFSLFFTSSYIYLTLLYPVPMVCLLWVPYIFTAMLSGLRPYVEHVGTTAQKGRDSRSWISPLFNFYYGNINYHQAHHLFPSVSAYKLKDFHKWLLDNSRLSREHSFEIHSVKEFISVASQKL